MTEDLLHQRALLDRGQKAQPAATTRSGENIDRKGAPQQLGPAEVLRSPTGLRLMLGGGLRADRTALLSRCRGGLAGKRAGAADRGRTVTRVRREDAVVQERVGGRPRDHRRQLLQQLSPAPGVDDSQGSFLPSQRWRCRRGTADDWNISAPRSCGRPWPRERWSWARAAELWCACAVRGMTAPAPCASSRWSCWQEED